MKSFCILLDELSFFVIMWWKMQHAFAADKKADGRVSPSLHRKTNKNDAT